MIRNMISLALMAVSTLPAFAQTQPADRSWIAASNRYANMLIEVVFKYHPEAGTQQGLSQFDTKASQPTLANEDQERQETEAVLAKLKSAAAEKQQQDVAEDLQIMIRRVNLNFKRQDFQRANEVPFYNASQAVFGGLQVLLDEQTPVRAPACGRGPHPRICRTGAWLHRAHRDPEAAHQRADGQAGRDLSRAG